jgi:hypothetical protein
MSIKFIFFIFFNFLPQTVKNDQIYIQTVKIVFKRLYLNLNRLIRSQYLTTVHRLQQSSTQRRLQCELYRPLYPADRPTIYRPTSMHACRYPRLNIIHINKSCRLSIVRFLIQEATREARETRSFAFPILYDPSPFGANHWSSSSKLTSRKQRAMSSRSGLWERETRESDELSSYGL